MNQLDGDLLEAGKIGTLTGSTLSAAAVARCGGGF
jgi:hypothetical protein